MESQSLTSTPTSTSSREPGRCRFCGVETVSVLLPALFGIPERWIPAPRICEDCDEKAEREAKVKAEQVRIEESFRAAMITPRFRDRTFASFEVTEQNRRAYEAAAAFRPVGDGQGLMFHGPTGVGKTHLAAAIANAYIGRVSVLYVSVPELLAEIRANMNRSGDSNRLEIAKRAELLILDDIGAEKPSEWVRETQFVLINHRYEHRLPTVYTSNCSLAEIEDRLGSRISSRIAEVSRVVRITGEDRRLKARG